MVMTPKIATCCYCGTRAALRLDGDRHELTCSNCGAPLRNLKHMAVEGKPRKPGKKKQKKIAKAYDYERQNTHYEQRRRPKRHRKSLMSKVFEEAFDVLEDIFD